MRIQTSQLEALHWIAQLGSFRAAALHLRIAQPTISARIRELEAILDTALFDRSSYRARLTASGRAFAQQAERMLALGQEMEHATSRSGLLWGTVRLGVCDTFALTGLPELLKLLEERFPELRLDLDIDNSVHLDRKLQEDRLDAAFLSQSAPSPGIALETMAELKLAWVASPHLELPERTLRPADMQSLPILINSSPSLLFRDVKGWFGAAGVQPRRVSTCSSLSILTRLAASGYGVTLLPVTVLQRELAQGELRILDTDPPIAPHPLALAYSIDPIGPDLAIIRDLARGLVQGWA